MKARLHLVPPSAAPGATPSREPAIEGTTRMLLLLLSRHRAAVLELARIEAEIAPHARAFADAHGEWVRPTIAQLRCRLGVKP